MVKEPIGEPKLETSVPNEGVESNSENLENNREKVETNEPAGLDNIGAKRAALAGLRDRMEDAEKEMSVAQQEIGKMRESLGLLQGETETAVGKEHGRLENEIEKIKKEIEGAETDYLGVPEEGEIDDSREEKNERVEKEYKGDDKENKEESPEDIEKMKEEFVEDFIEEAKENLMGGLQGDFESCENGDKAKELLFYKVEHTIREGTKSWIKDKNAGPVDFCLVNGVVISDFDSEGETLGYVTGIHISLEKNGFPVAGDIIGGDEKEKLVSEEENETLEQMKQAGKIAEREKGVDWGNKK